MWIQVAIWFATMLLGELLFSGGAPKPQTNTDQLEFPDTRQDRKIPLFAGTVQQKGPLLAWWGDVRKVAMTKSVKTGLFSDEDTLIGHKYYVAVQIVIGHGPIDAVTAVHVGRKEAWTGSTVDGPISGDQPNLFGPSEQEGGISGTLWVHGGALNQAPDSYAEMKLEVAPGYSGIAYGIWTNMERDGGGYLGNSKFPPEVWITAQRLPKLLGNGKHDIGGHANPAEFLYELLVNSRWGAGMPVDLVDKPSFQAAAVTLYNEGMGIAPLYNNEASVETIIMDVLGHIDGAIYSDIYTGKRTLVLARADYTLSSQPLFDEANSVLVDFSRPGWDETVNEVHVNYLDAATGEPASVVAQDLANQQIQQAVVARTIDYPACPTEAQAQKLAWRDLRALSLPLAKCTIRADRSAWVLRPGMVIRVSNAQRGFSEMAMRVNRINYGTMVDGQIEFECVQDVFNLSATIYGSSPGTGWVDPIGPPAVVRYPVLLEAPYHITRSAGTAEVGKLLTWAAAPAGDAFEYQIHTRQGAAPFVRRGTAPFGPTATLTAAINETAGTIQVGSGQDLDLLISTDSTGQAQGSGLMLIDNEWLSWRTKTNDGGGLYTLSTVYRGCLDTVPAAHASGARVRFLDNAMGTTADEYGLTSSVDAKYLTVSGGGILALVTATTLSVTFTQRVLRPYPPADVKINGTSYPVAILGAYALTWKHRDRTAQTTIISQADASIGPETGTTYTLRLYGEAGTLLRTATGLTGTSYTWTDEEADSGLSAPGGGADYAAEVLADSPVSYWKLDETSGTTATDATGGNNGTYMGGYTLNQPGIPSAGRPAVLFNGSSGYISLGAPAALNITAAWTLEACVYLTSTPNGCGVIAESYTGGSNPILYALGFGLSAIGANLEGGFYTGSDWRTAIGGTLALNVWHHIACTWDGTTLRLYADNSQVGTSSPASGPVAGINGLYIGRRHDVAGSPFFPGRNAEVAIYSAALAAGRITAHHNAMISAVNRLNGTVRTEIESVRAGLISHQKHNIITDRAGYGYQWGKYFGGL